jgi:Mrp family chromosome partitioning ATPase
VDDITPEMPLEEEALVESPVVSEPAHEPESAAVVPVASPSIQRHDAAPTPQGAATRVIALANQKGGVAKTTTTLNLGVALREMGHRVLIIDLDPQGNLTMSQGLNPDVIERSMFDVLVHKIPISEIIERREVDLAVASIDLAGAELALSAMIGRERSLEKALAEVRAA